MLKHVEKTVSAVSNQLAEEKPKFFVASGQRGVYSILDDGPDLCGNHDQCQKKLSNVTKPAIPNDRFKLEATVCQAIGLKFKRAD